MTVLPVLVFTLLAQTGSPISWYTEIMGGPYRPAIDSEFGGAATPYRDIFGPSRRPAWAVSLDYRLCGCAGSLYAGGALGFFYVSGNALASDGSKSEDQTALWLSPVEARVTYRADFVYTLWGVPLVPYVKAGLVYAPWWITKSDGSVAEWGDGTGKARGATRGWKLSFGLSLVLDPFEPAAARNMDHEWGVNHTYLFAEYEHLVLDGFGDGESLILSDDHWMFGLALEY